MNKQTLYIIISTVIIVLSSLALIVNNELNKMADSFGMLDLDRYDLLLVTSQTGADNQANPGSAGTPGNTDPGSGYEPGGSLDPLSPEHARLAAEIETRIQRPVDRKDLLKAAIILVGSLSREDLNYVYEVGRKPRPSKEEMLKVREILLTNLSAEDIAALKALGEKYGKSLRILDPSIPIR
ncbi:MAG: hypothetical protein ACOX0Q_06740 [Syntrophomonadaceae bacterium]|jgi:hypothetical protein